MKIDLCKLFNVEEGEEFKIKLFGAIEKYRFKNGKLERYDDDYIYKWVKSRISINDILESEIIKIPKKKEFTDDELCILRNIDKKWKWISRYKSGNLCIFNEKPNKCENKYQEIWENMIHSDYIEFHCYNNLFNSIKWEDEVYIDDYVKR